MQNVEAYFHDRARTEPACLFTLETSSAIRLSNLFLLVYIDSLVSRTNGRSEPVFSLVKPKTQLRNRLFNDLGKIAEDFFGEAVRYVHLT